MKIYKYKRVFNFVFIGILSMLVMVFALIKIININSTYALAEIPEGYTTFTDHKFYDCAVRGFRDYGDYDEDISNGLTDEQLSRITKMGYCSGVSDTTGIEKMINLEELDVAGSFSSIDLSYNSKLTDLKIESSNIDSVDLSHNIALTYFKLGNNSSYNIPRGKVTSIDLSNNIALTKLELSSHDISSLDLSYNINLTEIHLSGLVFDRPLDLSSNTALEYLSFFSIYQAGSSESVRFIDLSNNTALKSLTIAECLLSSIDLSNNIDLTYLSLNDRLQSIDLSKNTKLETLFISGDIPSLDLSKNVNLKYLSISTPLCIVGSDNDYSNDLRFIDLSQNTLLKDLSIDSNILIETGVEPQIDDGTYTYDLSNVEFLKDGGGHGLLGTLDVKFLLHDDRYMSYDDDMVLVVNDLEGAQGVTRMDRYIVKWDETLEGPDESYKIKLFDFPGQIESSGACVKASNSDDSNEDGTEEADIKVPDTGMFGGEKGNSMIAMISVGLIALASGIAYISGYIVKRYRGRVGFKK